jgi:hypothetical protein
MGFCDSPKKILKKKMRHRKTSYSTGRNAGNRHRGQPKMSYDPITYVVNQPGDDVTSFTSGSLFPSSVKSDEMWDTHGYIQNWYNICTREKYQGYSDVFPRLDDDDGPVITFTGNYSPRDLVRRFIPFLDSAALDELALRSEDKLSSVVQSNVSLANFIIELIETCDGNLKGIKRFRDIYTKAIEAYQKEYLRLIKAGHKAAAAHWLAWNFAIKPNIKDLQAILCSISAAYKKLKWLQDHNHKVVYLDYTRDKLEDLISYDPNEYHYGELFASIIKADPTGSTANGTHYIGVRYFNVSLSYHARSKIFLDIPDHYLRGMMGISQLWTAMMGLTNPVGIIWEAIPFSWLIDYFLSYRSRLFQTRNDFNLIDSGITVLGYGHSFSYKCFADTHHFRYFGGSMIDMGLFGGLIKYELYGRQAGLPFPEETTLFRVPSDWYHFSILGALAIGFLPKRK